MRVAHGQGAPACNVESCGSGLYPLQWACMIAVGCVLASEQHLRLQDTGRVRRNCQRALVKAENKQKKSSDQVWP